MASKEVEKVPAVDVQKPAEEAPKAAEALKAPVSNVKALAAEVEVVPAETFKCKHGKKWYSFEKNKPVKIPREVYEFGLKGCGRLKLTI